MKEKCETVTQTSLSGSKSVRELKIIITLKKKRDVKRERKVRASTFLACELFGAWFMIFELAICCIIYLITVWILRLHSRASVSFWRVSMNFWACFSSGLLGGNRPVQSQRSCQPLVTLYLWTQSKWFCYSHIKFFVWPHTSYREEKHTHALIHMVCCAIQQRATNQQRLHTGSGSRFLCNNHSL